MIQNLIYKLGSSVLENSEIDQFNSFFQNNEDECLLQIKDSLIKEEFNQERIDLIFINAKYLTFDLAFFVKKQTAEHIIFLYVENINKALLCNNILLKKEIYNNLYYILEPYPATVILNCIKDICNILQDSFIYSEELYTCLDKIVSIDETKVGEIFSLLPVEALFAIWTNALKNNRCSLHFELDKYLKKSDNFYHYVKFHLNDDSIFLKYLFETGMLLSEFSDKNCLYKIILEIKETIPKTMDRLLDYFIKHQMYDLILQNSSYYKQKNIVKKLFQAKDNSFLKKFIELNKSSNELKDLVVYY